jgi:flagellar biosynthesis/type III secretory pathway M-ring protein FliF/YscJ
MDFIKAQLDRIQQQLAGLNATQKMLTASLVAIMLITVVWWGKYAGEAEMVPLVSQSLTPAQIGQMQDVLGARGITTQISGDRILVHSDRRLEALSALTFARALPHLTDDGFKEMLQQMNPFDPQDKTEKVWNHQKQTFLSQVIGGMKGVTKADVTIDPTSSRRIEGNIEPSASVAMTLEDGVGDRQKLVDAAAALVVGSQSGLSYNHVTVVANGVVQRVHDAEHDDFASSGDQLELREKNEAYEEQRVTSVYHIRGLSVKVTVALNATTMMQDKKEYDAKGVIQKTIKSSEENEETTGGALQGGGEAGAVPNMGLPPAQQAGASAGPTQTRTRNEEQSQVVIPETITHSKTPAGQATPIAAAVQVPYSYYVREFKQRNPNVKDPTDKDVAPLIKTRLDELQQSVAGLLNLPSKDKVSIGTYPDIIDEVPVPPMIASSGISNISGLVGGHAKEIALGTLAIMSLFMATMMVRKGAPATVPAVATQQAPAAPPTILSGETLAGEATSGGAHLDGMELNEDAIKAQQMVEQVSTLVRENPDAAASLVKRWLNRN